MFFKIVVVDNRLSSSGLIVFKTIRLHFTTCILYIHIEITNYTSSPHFVRLLFRYFLFFKVHFKEHFSIQRSQTHAFLYSLLVLPQVHLVDVVVLLSFFLFSVIKKGRRRYWLLTLLIFLDIKRVPRHIETPKDFTISQFTGAIFGYSKISAYTKRVSLRLTPPVIQWMIHHTTKSLITGYLMRKHNSFIVSLMLNNL